MRRSDEANAKLLDMYTNLESCSIHDKHKISSNDYDEDDEFEREFA